MRITFAVAVGMCLLASTAWGQTAPAPSRGPPPQTTVTDTSRPGSDSGRPHSMMMPGMGQRGMSGMEQGGSPGSMDHGGAGMAGHMGEGETARVWVSTSTVEREPP